MAIQFGAMAFLGRFFLPLVVLVIAASATMANADEPPPKKNPFAGTWVIEYEEWGGVRHDGDMGKRGCWNIHSNVMRRRSWSSSKWYGDEYHLEVDEATPANGVNLRYISPGAPAAAGPKPPTHFPGICELSKDGNLLKFCWDRAGVRPTRFETAKDSQMHVLALKRLTQHNGSADPYDVDEKAGTAKMRLRMGQQTTDDVLKRFGNPDKLFGVHWDRRDIESNRGTGYWAPLTAIEIGSSKLVTDQGIAALASLERLEEVKIDSTPITGSGFAALKANKQLRSISIEDTNVDDAGLAALATLPQLERLRISAPNKITAKGLAQLADLKALRHFDFHQSSGFEQDMLPFGDAEVKHLEGLEHLRSLRVLPASLTDAGFASLAKIASLETLDLYGSKATPAGIAHLRALKGLRSLSLTCDGVSDDFLAEIARLPLEELQFNTVQATNAGLENLATCATLRKLTISAWQPSTFDDAGVAKLSALKELAHLRIHCYRLTAESLKIVEQLPRLERLSISSSLIKIEQKQEMQKRFPRRVID